MYMIWFGWDGFGWRINHCRLFNAKFFLYICIRYMVSKHILWTTFLNKPKLIFFILLNCFTYFYQIGIILFTINYLCAHSLCAMYHQ